MSQNLQLQKATNPQLTRIRHRRRLSITNPRFASRHPAYANFLDREAIRANATPTRLAPFGLVTGGNGYSVGDMFSPAGGISTLTAIGIVQEVSSTSTGTLTMLANAAALETVTIGSAVYTFKAALSDPFDVLIGALASDSIVNLVAAIIAGVGEGITHGTGTTANPEVTAAIGAGDTMDVSALLAGDDGNSVVTTETGAHMEWGADTLLNGGASAVGMFDAGAYIAAPGFASTTAVKMKNGKVPGTGLVVDATFITGVVSGVTNAELIDGLRGVTDITGNVPTITRARHFRDDRQTDSTYTDNGVPIV